MSNSTPPSTGAPVAGDAANVALRHPNEIPLFALCLIFSLVVYVAVGIPLVVAMVGSPALLIPVLLCGLAGETVPWADSLAVIAAIDAVADQRTQLYRNAALELDRQVGDAAARIELERRDDRRGRTDINAGIATAAVFLSGVVDR